MTSTVFHVVPAHDGWRVDQEGVGAGIVVAATREEALREAQERAAAQRPCKVVIHREGGAVESELEFPVPVPG